MAESEVAAEVRELSRSLLPEVDRLGVLMADRICAEIPGVRRWAAGLT